MSQSKTNSKTSPQISGAGVTAVVGQIAMDTLVEQIVPDVSKKMAEAGITISPSSVMQVLRIAMEAVEGAPIKGEKQKDLAIKIVMEIAQGANLPEEHMFLIKSLVDGGLVSDTIDIIIDATRGKLDINKAKEVAQGCFARCFSAIFRRKKTTNNGGRERIPSVKGVSQSQTQPKPVPESVVSMTSMEEALVMLPPKMATAAVEDVKVQVEPTPSSPKPLGDESQPTQPEQLAPVEQSEATQPEQTQPEQTQPEQTPKAPLKNQFQFQLKK